MSTGDPSGDTAGTHLLVFHAGWKESSRHVGSPISWAPGCQMLTWEISPALHFHALLCPPLKKMRELGGRKGHTVDAFLQKLALVIVLEIHLLKALLVCVREPCFVHSIKFFFFPPRSGVFKLGPEIFCRHRMSGCRVWPTGKPVGVGVLWSDRWRQWVACATAPWQGPLQWLVQGEALGKRDWLYKDHKDRQVKSWGAVGSWFCCVFFLLGSSIQLWLSSWPFPCRN